MNITHVTVMSNPSGTDTIYVHTDLPSPFPVEVTDQPVTMKFEVQRGKGLAYAKTHFSDYPLWTLDGSTGKKEQIQNPTIVSTMVESQSVESALRAADGDSHLFEQFPKKEQL